MCATAEVFWLLLLLAVVIVITVGPSEPAKLGLLICSRIGTIHMDSRLFAQEIARARTNRVCSMPCDRMLFAHWTQEYININCVYAYAYDMYSMLVVAGGRVMVRVPFASTFTIPSSCVSTGTENGRQSVYVCVCEFVKLV